jgi:hypothetical protein
VSGQPLAPATLPPGNEMGGWVGPGIALDFRKRDKSLAPAVIGTLDCAVSILVTILTTQTPLLSKFDYMIYLTYIVCRFLV